jgi:Protein of unknown function (DUF1475)
MKHRGLIAFFLVVLISILAVTTWASLEQNVLLGFQYLFESRWGIATLFDTYFGFITIYLWIAYKEVTWGKRILWLALILTLGSIAFSIYILNQLRLLKNEPIESLLIRKSR